MQKSGIQGTIPCAQSGSWVSWCGLRFFLGATMLGLVKSCISSSQFGDLVAWPYEADGIAFEAIPRTLAQNCGVNVVRTTTALQVKHVNGENAWIGIDGNTGSITDVKEKKHPCEWNCCNPAYY